MKSIHEINDLCVRALYIVFVEFFPLLVVVTLIGTLCGLILACVY